MKRISFIVPVYNVEAYVEKCVKSLLSQSLNPNEYEIVLVDDGSTDSSGSKCDDLSCRYDVITVIHQSNQGLSRARNTGLESATGRFIQFVDSDDFLEENVVSDLIDRMETDELEILRFQWRKVKENSDLRQGRERPEFVPLVTCIIPGPDFLTQRMGFECYACQYIIRRSFLVDNKLLFKDGIIFEDVEWTPRVLNKAARVSETNLVVYNYLMREGSITRGKTERVVEGQFFLLGEIQKQMVGVQDKRWYQGMIAHLVVTIITTVATRMYNQRKEYLPKLKGYNVLPLSTFRANQKARRKIVAVNISPWLACFLIHRFND